MSDPSGGNTHVVLALLRGLALVFFIAAGIPMLVRRRALRRAAIVTYLVALAIAVALIVIWLASSAGFR